MPVNSNHPDYADLLPQWTLVEDVVAGQDKVKEKKETYLPIPPGMKKSNDFDLRYNFFVELAQMPDTVGESLRAMIGIAFRKEPKIELTPRLEKIKESATVDGKPLMTLVKDITKDVLMTGRVGLLTDVGDNTDDVWLVPYGARSVLNWRTTALDGGRQLTRAVVEENLLIADADDQFVSKEATKWLDLSLIEGKYTVQKYMRIGDDASTDPVPIDEPKIPTSKGKPLTEIPFVFIGSTDLTPEPDQIPLLGMSRRIIAYYWKSAVFERGLHFSLDPTLAIIGMDVQDPNAPQVTGSGQTLYIPSPDGDVKYVTADSSAMAEVAKARDNEERLALAAGAKLLDSGAKVESGEALRIRQGAQSATLASVIQTVGRGVEQSLKTAAVWLGEDPEKIVFEPNMEFITEEASAQLLNSLFDGFERGVVPIDMIADYTRKAGLHNLSADEYSDTIAAVNMTPTDDENDEDVQTDPEPDENLDANETTPS